MKTILEIKGKCNSTLVLYLLNISVLSVKENSAASVGLVGPVKKFLSIFCAVLLSLHLRIMNALLCCFTWYCCISLIQLLPVTNISLDKNFGPAFSRPFSYTSYLPLAYGCLVILLYICSFRCLVPSLFFSLLALFNAKVLVFSTKYRYFGKACQKKHLWTMNVFVWVGVWMLGSYSF